MGVKVDEVDPTGAGDCFCAGFAVAMLDGLPLREACGYANAVGALAVTRKGPTEGAPTRQEVLSLMRQPASPVTEWSALAAGGCHQTSEKR